MIHIGASKLTTQFVRDIGIEPTLKLYNAEHTITSQEITDIVDWL